MSQTTLELAYRLTQEEQPFVLATVVWCERPTSAKPGAQAIIHSDGRVTGWIGGSCAQPVVVREARRILQEGSDPYLLRLGTLAGDMAMARSDIKVFPMTCSSGGALDIYMEPHLPRPRLLLVGDSPDIVALSQIASVLQFAVAQVDPMDIEKAKIDQRTFVVVATHGEFDEDVLLHVLPSPAVYVGMVGSRRRAAAIREFLKASGLADESIARLRVPAGLDIGAITPEEIAASILAELVKVRRQLTHFIGPHPTMEAPVAAESLGSDIHDQASTETASDPVCGMIVETKGARHHTTYQGREIYFCCPACKRLFEQDPQHYLVHEGASS